jgi:hypothetical protein
MSPLVIILSLVGTLLVREIHFVTDPPVIAFPYIENFESVVPPDIPDGWTVSNNRIASGDFTTEEFQGNNRLLARNATLEQFIRTPVIDFTGYRPEQIRFIERRSGTFGAEIRISAVIGGENDITIPIGRTSLESPNVFIERMFILPPELSGLKHVRFEWRVIPAADGTSGLLRLDEVMITANRVYDHDLRIIDFHLERPFVAHTDRPEIGLTIYNAGLLHSGNFIIEIGDSTDTLKLHPVEDPLAPGDSLLIHLTLPPLSPGLHTLSAIIGYPLNQQTDLNRRELTVYVSESITQLPWNEIFDTPHSPLPAGWRSSITAGITDADLTTSIVHKGTHALLLRNAARRQYIVLPPFDPAAGRVDSLRFFERRTGTFDATVYVDISFDGGKSFSDPIATFTHTGENDYVRRDVVLARIGEVSEPFYIRLLNEGDGTGTTGTVRFDDFMLSGKLYHNITLTDVSFTPPIPSVNDIIVFRALLRNNGLHEAFPIDLLMFVLNPESDAWDHVQTRSPASPLQPDEEIEIEFVFNPTAPVPYQFMFETGYAPDQYTTDNFITISVHPSPEPATLVINEIMYAPVSPEPEWIELYNAGPEAINLNGWSVSDQDSNRRYYIEGSDLIIESSGYAVLTRDASHLTGYGEIPSPVISVPSKPVFLWNLQGDAVIIYDHNGVVHDRVEYVPGWGGTGGRSLERIDYAADTRDLLNWGSSVSAGTPGRVNSIGRRAFDLAAASIAMHPETPAAGEEVEFTLTIRNPGRESAGSFTVSLYKFHGEPEYEIEIISTISVQADILPSDSMKITLPWNSPPAGYTMMRAEITYEPDERPEDNFIDFELLVIYPASTLLINEILYHPTELQPEYIEIHNPGLRAVDLRGWSIRDRPTAGGNINRYIISGTSALLSPGSFAIVASDSSLFTSFDIPADAFVSIPGRTALGFNTAGDEVILLDPSGSIIDSVNYTPAWHHPDVIQTRGRSLERISPFALSIDRYNWSTSADPRGGTPGRHNSLYTEIPVTVAELTASPNPFSPTGDGYNDHTVISFELPEQTSTIRIRIFDSVGRQIRTLLNNMPSGPRGMVIWDGRSENGRRVRLGIYIILLEAYDGYGSTLRQLKRTVIVADRL